MYKSELLAAVSLLALACAVNTASAADLVTPATSEEAVVSVPSAAASDWSGFNIGIGIISEYGSDTLYKEDGKTLNSMPLSGLGGFVEGGYDFQSGDFVFGVTGNFDLLNTSAEYQKSAKTTITETLGSGWGAGVRAGLLANESTLVFGSLGYTSRSLDLNYDYSDDTFDDEYSTTVSGYYLGAGVETKLMEHLSLKAEYRFSQFDGFTATDITKSNKNYVSDGFDTHQVRMSLNWDF
jgi:outer membrane immunogenic protein